MKKKNKGKKRPLRQPIKEEVRIHHHDFEFEIGGVKHIAELKIWKELKNGTS